MQQSEGKGSIVINNKRIGLIITIVTAAIATTVYAMTLRGFHKTFTPANAPINSGNCPNFNTSGDDESITATPGRDFWIVKAGGQISDTHYSRIRYKLPECSNIAPSRFYGKIIFVLPSDFYSQMQAGFRLMNTDNFTATRNGLPVGALDENELRCGWHIYNSDKLLRFICAHETKQEVIYYTSPSPLTTGEHSLEMYGSLMQSVPWYLKVDGVTVATGNEVLGPTDTLASERVVTRMNAGIDGAADQSDQTMQYLIKSFEIADYDVNSIRAGGRLVLIGFLVETIIIGLLIIGNKRTHI